MRGVCHQLARCCHFAGHCWKRMSFLLFVGRSIFLYACVAPFSCQRPLGVTAYFNNFLFLIQFNFFLIYLFIPDTTKWLRSARILRRTLEAWDFIERPSANADVINSQGVNNNNNNNKKKNKNNNQQKKKRIFKIVDFAVPADHRINLKESEKKDKYLDLARELKKLWNMKVTIVPIVIGALGTVTKGLLKGLDHLEVGGWVETIQTTALLRTARILRRVLETWGDLLSLKLQWKTIC